jgi:hypothetical protein
VTWDNEFTVPFGPDIVPSAVTSQVPAEATELPFEVAAAGDGQPLQSIVMRMPPKRQVTLMRRR